MFRLSGTTSNYVRKQSHKAITKNCTTILTFIIVLRIVTNFYIAITVDNILDTLTILLGFLLRMRRHSEF